MRCRCRALPVLGNHVAALRSDCWYLPDLSAAPLCLPTLPVVSLVYPARLLPCSFHDVLCPDADSPTAASQLVVNRAKRAVPYPLLGENTLVLSDVLCVRPVEGQPHRLELACRCLPDGVCSCGGRGLLVWVMGWWCRVVYWCGMSSGGYDLRSTRERVHWRRVLPCLLCHAALEPGAGGWGGPWPCRKDQLAGECQARPTLPPP
jgi:hypothetical protein